MKHLMTKKLNQVLALVLTIVALMVGQEAWADQTWSITDNGNSAQNVTYRNFHITRTETTKEETVKYRTVSLTALAGKQFQEVTGEVTFGVGESEKTVSVTELSLGDADFIYCYNIPDMSRSYRFEVFDKDDHELVHFDRVFNHETRYDVDPTKIFQNVEVTVFTDPVTVDDAANGFGQAHYEINSGGSGFFSATAPQNYFSGVGLRLAMSFDFQAKEKEDGYQYIQVLVNNYQDYDSGNQNGDVGELENAQLLAGFGHDPGKKNTHYAYYTFPVPADGDIAYDNHDGLWRQYGNTVGRLYSQKIKPGYLHAKSGRMLADADFTRIVIRFDASGKNDDQWQVKNLKAHIQAIDESNPTVIIGDIRLSPAPYTAGSTFYLCVPFNEIVQVYGTPTITTNWGDLTYYMGSGTNVLIFRGIIGTGIDPTAELTVTALSGGTVKDLRGNPFTGQENSIGVTFPAQYTPHEWGTGDGTKDNPYIISDGKGLDELRECVNTSGIDFGPDASHPDGYFFKLDADITYNGSSVNNYIAIGDPTHPFKGNFDGDGHVISGININKANESYQGFFGYAVGGTIKNIVVEHSIICNNGGDYAGAVVGCCIGGTVSGCRVYDTTVYCDGNHHGAVVGNNAATLECNCYFACTVSGQVGQNVYTLGLGTGITASAPTITYNNTKYYIQEAQVTLTAPFGKGLDVITVTKDADNSDVTASVLSGTTIIMPDYDISVSATFTDLWGIDDGSDGSDQKPYIISNATGWNLMASEVNKGANFWNTYFKLSDDFDNSAEPITTMVGNSDHHFNGRIFGNGRTLTVNLSNTTEDNGCAPFFRLNQGYIENLRVAGTITTDDKFAAGIASHMIKSKLWGCVSSVTIISSVDGDGTHGGLVGVIDDWGWENELTGCVFDGVICCTAPNLTHSCGGLIGWKGGSLTYPASVVVEECLYAPAAIPDGKYAPDTTNCCTFLRGEGDEHYLKITISSCYYTETFGSVPTLREGARKVYPLATRPVDVKEAVKKDFGFAKTHDAHCIEYGGTFYTDPAYSSLDEDGKYSIISFKNGSFTDIALEGRVLYKDGDWNTLCLPFAMSAEQIAASPLAGADIRTLSSASFENGTLTLNFTDKDAVTSISGGVPYIIRWDRPDPYVRYNGQNEARTSDIVEPTIEAIFIDFTQHDATFDLGGGKSITFVGTRASKTYDSEDKSVLFLGGENKLYYPQNGATIKAQRAYFQLQGLTISDVSATKMWFGDSDSEEATSLSEELRVKSEESDDAIYNLSGQKLSKPQKGINIINGKKMFVK